MKLLVRSVACLALALSLTGCSGEDTVMPDLNAKRLDIALSDLDRAGYGDEPEVLGGGMFGVVDESNWTVCDQDPAPGDTVTGTPRLTVDRSCASVDELDGKETQPTKEPSESSNEEEASLEVREPKRERPHRTRTAETFVMPLLVGANLQDAQDHLQSLGSFLLTQNDATGLERFQILDSDWKVCAQFPAAGTRVSLARMVDLRVVKLHEACP
jgi:beta-lactam-binding protein with PASTA domain